MFPATLPLLLSLTLLSFSSSPPAHAKSHPQNLQSMNMDPFELDTLFHIMEIMSSDRKWRISNPNPCHPGSSWPGIECKPGNDNRMHVSRLDFGIPPNPTCKTTATFPTQIFNLPYLQSVFFFSCFKHTKTIISIPPQASHKSNTSLQQFSLRSNTALVGPIPSDISTLRSLQILTLSQNLLHGKIPEEICSLSSLIHLDLSYNFLTGSIPDQIGNLRNLVGLDFSYNSLTGIVPAGIGQMVLLQKLDLSSNSLAGGVPDSLENLSLLVFIALSNNRLKGKFPKGLGKLQSLQYFIMDDNPMFMPLPADFGKLAKLQELRLASSGYWGAIPASFSRLSNLSSLCLQNNDLSGGIPFGFRNLSHIYHLNLSRNQFGGVVPFDAGFLRRLGRNLDLSGNPGLCFNRSEGVEVELKLGVGICGINSNSSSNRAGSLTRALKRSRASSVVCSTLGNMVGFFCVCGLLYGRLF